jgi:two-component system, cell cycle sensor histidine kinase and response regulator CckA
VRERDQDTPFMFVSGTIGEERAVESLRRGATDYILKDRVSRLTSAIERVIAEHAERRARRASEARVREQAALLDEAREAIAVRGLDRRVTYWNQGAEQLYGWTAKEAEDGMDQARVPDAAEAALNEAWAAVLAGGRWDGTLTLCTRAGDEIIALAPGDPADDARSARIPDAFDA